MSLIRVSEKKIAANRANAQKSRGPTTPEGKVRSSRNACKHHLYARKFIMPAAWEARIWDVVNPCAATVADPFVRARLADYYFLKQWRIELYAYESRLLNQSIARHRSATRGIRAFLTQDHLFHAIESRIHVVHAHSQRARLAWRRAQRENRETQTTPNVAETKPLTMAAAAGSSPLASPPIHPTVGRVPEFPELREVVGRQGGECLQLGGLPGVVAAQFLSQDRGYARGHLRCGASVQKQCPGAA